MPLGEATRRATVFVSRFILGGGDKTRLEEEVKAVIAHPGAFTDDPLGGLCAGVAESPTAAARAGGGLTKEGVSGANSPKYCSQFRSSGARIHRA